MGRNNRNPKKNQRRREGKKPAEKTFVESGAPSKDTQAKPDVNEELQNRNDHAKSAESQSWPFGITWKSICRVSGIVGVIAITVGAYFHTYDSGFEAGRHDTEMMLVNHVVVPIDEYKALIALRETAGWRIANEISKERIPIAHDRDTNSNFTNRLRLNGVIDDLQQLGLPELSELLREFSAALSASPDADASHLFSEPAEARFYNVQLTRSASKLREDLLKTIRRESASRGLDTGTSMPIVVPVKVRDVYIPKKLVTPTSSQ